MKTTAKNISLLLAGFFLIGSLTTATAQRTAFADSEPGSGYIDPVAAIHQNIANLELELETLRMVDKRSLTKSEKRVLKRKKRFTRRRLSQQYDMLNRISTPMTGYGYGYGYYGPYPQRRYNPYRTNTRVIVRNTPAYCPPVNSQRPRNATTTTTNTTTRPTTTRTAPATRSNSVDKSVKYTARKIKP